MTSATRKMTAPYWRKPTHTEYERTPTMQPNEQTAVKTIDIIAVPLPVALIYPSPLNRKSHDADADIAELAYTIDENGLLCPISVRPRADGRYEIICGERRWRAFRLLERETIPCFVKDLDDAQAQIERIVENYQRRDPSFMEQGEAVAALMELTGGDVSEVANRLGQSISWVRRRAKLPNLIPAWREELAKDNTPYHAIRDTVNKLEEIAILPPNTQLFILNTGMVRHSRTVKEMREIIAKYFMNLDAKPWTRAWEKKAFSGSGKKRCDACMKRSDRENALFADPDAPSTGERMCLDPQCWKNKCLSWCKDLIDENPGMVPMRQGYGYGGDNLAEIFGVAPVARYEWQERNTSEAEREGYAAAVGVFVDGPEIGTTKSIWLEEADEDDKNNDVSSLHDWREHRAQWHRMREALAELIATDIAAYLADIDANTTIPAAQLARNQLRAAVWFGIDGYANAEEENASLDNPDWNPLAWAWNRTAEHIAEHVARVAAEDMAQLYNGDTDNSADADNAAALRMMFEIPLDVIATRATEALYMATRNELDTDTGNLDESDKLNDETPDDSLEAAASFIAITDETFVEPDDFISIQQVPYFHALAEAQ